MERKSDSRGRSSGGFNRGGDRGGFRGGGSFNQGPREMHKATCDECKQECEVPFKPTQGKPVFCSNCYKKKKGY
ncbi:DNA-directed RNA polymerase [Candidatus Pacearchaeota archaeon CG1_02_32_132]|nr:MAG: DNA-directed RNA polymerase [Candidatus Pacearchaeota archaeon CG1_02_32_132]